MRIYSIGGVTGPEGVATQDDSPPLLGATLPAVSFPTLGSLTPDEDSDGWEHAWWKVVVPESGPRWVDGDLSYSADGSPLDSYADIYTFDGTDWNLEGGGGSFTFTAGVTYYVTVGRSFGSGDGTSRMVLRVGDLAAGPTDWFQGDDVQWVVSGPNNHVTRDDNPFPSSSNHTFAFWDAGLWEQGMGYNGHYGMFQAFDGPHPATETEAIKCSWRNARVGNAGSQWWSEDPTNPDPDVRDQWHGGPGTKILHDGGDEEFVSGTTFPNLTGTIYQADPPGLFDPGKINFDTFAESYRLNLSRILVDFGPTAGRSVSPTDDGLPDDFDGAIEFEDDQGSYGKLEVRPDEFVIDGTNVGDIGWYLKPVPLLDGVEGAWGPVTPDPDTDLPDDGWRGGDDRPEGFAGTQPMSVENWHGQDGYTWQEVDGELVTDALMKEAADDQNPGGLRAVALHNDLLSFLVPADCTPSGAEDERIEAYRAFQMLAIRLTLTPARHRWIPEPVPPDVDVTGVGLAPQRLTNRNFGLVNSTYYRQGGLRLSGPL